MASGRFFFFGLFGGGVDADGGRVRVLASLLVRLVIAAKHLPFMSTKNDYDI